MESITEVQELLNSVNEVSGGTGADFGIDWDQIMLFVVVPSVLITILLIVWLIVSTIRRRRLEKAVYEIRDILRQMNERQQPTKTSVPVPSTDVNIEK